MNGEWVGYALTALGTLATTGLGLLAWRVSHRTQQATERNLAHEQDEAAFARMKSLVDFFDGKWQESNRRLESLETERTENRRKAEEDRRELDEMHRAVDTLRAKITRLEGRLIRAVNYIRDLLAWASVVSAATPHPAVPDDIADLIDTSDRP